MTQDKYGFEKGSHASIKAWADLKRSATTLTDEDKRQLAEEAQSRRKPIIERRRG